jgi:hypothetical protein
MPYGIFTSPFYTLACALITKLLGHAHLIGLTNTAGWLSGGVTTALAMVLLRQLGASRGWSVAGAVGVGLVPGSFYMSLYGYPSQCALPFFFGSAVAWTNALTATDRRIALRWLGVATLAFCGLTLMKIDFAVAGTLLISIAIVVRQERNRLVWLLPGVAAVSVLAAFLVARFAIEDRGLAEFLSLIDRSYPWTPKYLRHVATMTVVFSCGIGTLLLLAGALLLGFLNSERRRDTGRILVAWAVGALPIWLFWIARPPMSTRHALPGVVVTVLLAALAASQLRKTWPAYAPWVWLAALVGLNWPLGTPNFDFNFFPSGNLAATTEKNRRAFEVGEELGRQIAARRQPVKVLFSKFYADKLGRIDFTPSIAIALARRSVAVHSAKPEGAARVVSSDQRLLFVEPDGYETLFLPYQNSLKHTRQILNGWDPVGAGYYSIVADDVSALIEAGIDVKSFDVEEMFTELGSFATRRFPEKRSRIGAEKLP